MRKIVECIPNFSEGRRPEIIDQIVAAIRSIPEAVLLDHESDPNHNRSVITFVAPPDKVVDGAVAAARKAAELIDLNHHQGEHPRMGATDVIPFVPIAGVTMEDCVELARQCGQRLWTDLGIPVYLYEKAATRPDRENLANLRKGQFEGIRDEIADNDSRKPDYGDPRVHASAGITAVGARPALIAYNVNLATSDVEVANKVARAVRHLSGGLRYVKALGFELKDRGIVQVSMNMVNHEGTPLHRAFEMVKREAERYGVRVLGSEIVGLVPQRALNACSDFYLQLENFSEDQILENRLASAASGEPLRSAGVSLDASTGDFAELVASSAPTPGGGSVAAESGVLAAALGRMMCNITIGKKKYAEAEGALKDIKSQLEGLGGRLKELITEDAASFDSVMGAYRLPKDSDEQKASRGAAIERATLQAASTPLETAQRSVEVLRHLKTLAEIGNPNALSDVATGAQLALAATRGACYNVGINLNSLTDREAAVRLRDAANLLLTEARATARAIEEKLLSTLS